MAKKYAVSYVAGATGYGWEEEFDRLDEFEGFVDEMRHEASAYVIVWDNEIQKFIFWKECLTCKIKIDMLHDSSRDMRTKTRTKKGVE